MFYENASTILYKGLELKEILMPVCVDLYVYRNRSQGILRHHCAPKSAPLVSVPSTLVSIFCVLSTRESDRLDKVTEPKLSFQELPPLLSSAPHPNQFFPSLPNFNQQFFQLLDSKTLVLSCLHSSSPISFLTYKNIPINSDLEVFLSFIHFLPPPLPVQVKLLSALTGISQLLSNLQSFLNMGDIVLVLKYMLDHTSPQLKILHLPFTTHLA